MAWSSVAPAGLLAKTGLLQRPACLLRPLPAAAANCWSASLRSAAVGAEAAQTFSNFWAKAPRGPSPATATKVLAESSLIPLHSNHRPSSGSPNQSNSRRQNEFLGELPEARSLQATSFHSPSYSILQPPAYVHPVRAAAAHAAGPLAAASCWWPPLAPTSFSRSIKQDAANLRLAVAVPTPAAASSEQWQEQQQQQQPQQPHHEHVHSHQQLHLHHHPAHPQHQHQQPQAAGGGGDDALLDSVVKIFTVATSPNYLLPWQNKPQRELTGSGFAISGRRILTNAHVVADQTYVLVRRHGSPKRFRAHVAAVAHDCDLALLKIVEPADDGSSDGGGGGLNGHSSDGSGVEGEEQATGFSTSSTVEDRDPTATFAPSSSPTLSPSSPAEQRVEAGARDVEADSDHEAMSAAEAPATAVAAAAAAGAAAGEVSDVEEFWRGMVPLELGDIPRLQEEVAVVGYPQGGDNISITTGVVSRVEPTQYAHSAALLLAIQIDAAINPGNSGGPALMTTVASPPAIPPGPRPPTGPEAEAEAWPKTGPEGLVDERPGHQAPFHGAGGGLSHGLPVEGSGAEEGFVPQHAAWGGGEGWAGGDGQSVLPSQHVTVQHKVAGVAFQNLAGAENIGYIIPVPIIRRFLEDAEAGCTRFQGFSSLGVSCQPLENEQLRAHLAVPHGVAGVVVNAVQPLSSASGVIEKDDVITAVDGVAIANDGSVHFRKKERLPFDYLVSLKAPGQSAHVSVLRRGTPMSFDIPLKPLPPLVPTFHFDLLPSYFIFAGLVFVPLTQSYLHEYGPDWFSTSPRRLCDRALRGIASAPGQQVVILSRVLTDEVNSGFERLAELEVKRVNGVEVRNLRHLRELVRGCTSEYVRFDLDDDRVAAISVAAGKKANARILRRYRVPSAVSEDLVRPEVSEGQPSGGSPADDTTGGGSEWWERAA